MNKIKIATMIIVYLLVLTITIIVMADSKSTDRESVESMEGRLSSGALTEESTESITTMEETTEEDTSNDTPIAETSSEVIPETDEAATIETTAVTEAATEVITEAATEAAPVLPLRAVPLSQELQAHVIHTAWSLDIDPDIVFAVIIKESNGNINAIGDGGQSIGLMQIQPRWWQGLANERGLNINSPADNITLGTILLKRQLDIHGGHLGLALTAYNSGRGDHINGYAMRVMEIITQIKN